MLNPSQYPNRNPNPNPNSNLGLLNQFWGLLRCQVSVIPIRSFHFIVLIHITRHTHRDKVIAISVSMYYIVSMDNEVFIFIQQATFTKANIIATTVSMTIAYVPKHPVQQYFTSFHECFHLNILQPQNCSIIAEWSQNKSSTVNLVAVQKSAMLFTICSSPLICGGHAPFSRLAAQWPCLVRKWLILVNNIVQYLCKNLPVRWQFTLFP